MKTTAKQRRELKAKMDAVNNVIACRNLYAVQDVTGVMRRVFNCEIHHDVANGVHALTVEDLYSGHKYFVSQTKFQDGYGKEVFF